MSLLQISTELFSDDHLFTFLNVFPKRLGLSALFESQLKLVAISLMEAKTERFLNVTSA